MNHKGLGYLSGRTDVGAKPLTLPFHVCDRPRLCALPFGSNPGRSRRSPGPEGNQGTSTRSATDGSYTPSLSGWTPTVAQEIGLGTGQLVHVGKFFYRGADAKRPLDLGGGHGHRGFQSQWEEAVPEEVRWQWESTNMK